MDIISNIQTYLKIATESLEESERLLDSNRHPKPNDEAGHIITADLQQRSFKHALIALVFAGVFLEALLHIEGCRRLGRKDYEKIDRCVYREKLEKLGICDKDILDGSDRLRLTRKEVLHEKAVLDASNENAKIRFAQREARKAIDLVRAISNRLQIAP